MSEAPLHHRLYTHAGDGGGKFQKLGKVDAETVLSSSQLAKLDKLMASIRPPSEGRAHAAARFGPFVCLIISESALDGRGRSGARTEARVVRVPPKTAMLDLPALIDSDSHDTVVPIAAWSTVNVEQLDVAGVIAAFLASVPREETVNAPAADLRLIANAWSLLPLTFQESISWSLNASEGARVRVAFGGGSASTIPPSVRALAKRWIDWVLDRPDDAKRLIETTRATSLRDFEEELDEVPMPTTKPRPQPQRGTSLDPQLVEFLNTQIRASEDSIYDWLEEELASRRGGQATLPVRTGTIPPPPLLIAAAVVLVALATLGFFLWKSQQRIARLERQVVALSDATGVPEPPAAAAEEPEVSAPVDILKTPQAIPGAGWPERFQWVVDNRQRDVAPMIVAVARSATLPQKTASDLQRMTDALARNEVLNATDRRKLRSYLFQLVAPRASRNEDDAAIQSEVVLRWIAERR